MHPEVVGGGLPRRRVMVSPDRWSGGMVIREREHCSSFSEQILRNTTPKPSSRPSSTYLPWLFHWHEPKWNPGDFAGINFRLDEHREAHSTGTCAVRCASWKAWSKRGRTLRTAFSCTFSGLQAGSRSREPYTRRSLQRVHTSRRASLLVMEDHSRKGLRCWPPCRLASQLKENRQHGQHAKARYGIILMCCQIPRR